MSAHSLEPSDPLDQLSPQEREIFAAMVERMRQMRRRRGVPEGMSAQDAVTASFISVADLELARWGDSAPAMSITGNKIAPLGDAGHGS